MRVSLYEAQRKYACTLAVASQLRPASIENDANFLLIMDNFHVNGTPVIKTIFMTHWKGDTMAVYILSH